MQNGPNESCFLAGLKRVPILWPTKIVVPKNVPFLFVNRYGLIEDHVNDRISTKLGGVVKEMKAIPTNPGPN